MSDRIADRLRVAHVIGALVVGGAERFVKSLTEELASLGQDVALLTLSSRSDRTTASSLESLKKAGVEVHPGPAARVRMRAVFRLASRLRKLEPDIVHLHTPNTELAYWLAMSAGRPRAKVVRTIHSTSIPANAAFRLAWHGNRGAATIACSTSVKSSAAHLSAEVRVIRNGVRFDWPPRTSESLEQARRALGLDPQTRLFVAAGRMDGNYKGFDVLIEAWKAARLSGSACLHLLGDGAIRSELEASAGTNTGITFHGTVTEVCQWLTAADCFVMPSRHEGLPLVGIEAAGTGIHCLFSDIGPLRELEAASVTWVAPGIVDELAHALRQAAAGRRIFVDPAEVKRYRRAFGIEKTARQYMEVYESVLYGRER